MSFLTFHIWMFCSAASGWLMTVAYSALGDQVDAARIQERLAEEPEGEKDIDQARALLYLVLATLTTHETET
jgi:hypothetical protein